LQCQIKTAAKKIRKKNKEKRIRLSQNSQYHIHIRLSLGPDIGFWAWPYCEVDYALLNFSFPLPFIPLFSG
jgi:hypothetical protein